MSPSLSTKAEVRYLFKYLLGQRGAPAPNITSLEQLQTQTQQPMSMQDPVKARKGIVALPAHELQQPRLTSRAKSVGPRMHAYQHNPKNPTK